MFRDGCRSYDSFHRKAYLSAFDEHIVERTTLVIAVENPAGRYHVL